MIRYLERRGWHPVEVQDSYAMFILPHNALTIWSAKKVLGKDAPQSQRPGRLRLGGDEISISMSDGPLDRVWNVLITCSAWGNKFHRQGWRSVEQTERDIQFVVPKSGITVRSRNAVENPTLRGVALGRTPKTEPSDDDR